MGISLTPTLTLRRHNIYMLLQRVDLTLGFGRFVFGVSGLVLDVFEFILTFGQAALGFLFAPEDAPSGRVTGGGATGDQSRSD